MSSTSAVDDECGLMLIPFRKMRAHTKTVSGITFFNDLRHAITCSWDGTLQIWDVQKGTLVGEPLKGHEGPVFSVTVSPDDRRIASGGDDAMIIIWDIGSKRKVFDPLVKHTYGVNSVCWSPDGKRLASGSIDSKVIIWNAETGAIILMLQRDRTCMCSVAFSPDGLKLAAGLGDGRLRVWWTNNGEFLFEIQSHDSWIRSVVWSPDSRQLVSASYDKTVKFWDAFTGLQIGEPCTGHTARIRSLAISFDGSFIATGSDDNTVRLWSTETHQQMGKPHEFSSQVYCIAISPNGARLASGHYNQDFFLWSIKNARPTADYPPHLQQRGRSDTPEVLDMQTEFDASILFQDLTKYITKIEEYPVTRGGFGEIWECIYSTDQGPTKVAVKSLLTYISDKATEKKTKRIQREFRTCARLKHPNILAVYGYTYGFGRFMAIVSPWAQNGNLTAYLEQEDATLTPTRRFKILGDIAAGLEYLHANHVIHGDLNGPNVLIHGDGTACLADFGLSLMYSEVMSISAASWTSAFHGNIRWLAPELLGDPEDELPIRPTMHSDIYSFGGIMLHVLTGKTPYYYLIEAAVIQRIGTGIKPLRSRYRPVSDKHWRFINICWSDVETRPSAEEAVEWIGDELDLLSGSGTAS